jgi:hypothetical protein
MNKSDVTRFLRGIDRTIAKHSPEILTGIGIAGMITTTILAVKATPKALRICEEVKAEHEEPKKLDYVKATWKCYIPAAVTGVVSTACLIGASSVNLKRNAALATAYQISQTALTEYKDKVVETVGEETEKVIREKVAQDKIDKNPDRNNGVVIFSDNEYPCYDSISGRYFQSSESKIKEAVNNINYRLLSEMYISLNEFYDELGLPRTAIGDEIGWNIDNGLLEVYLSDTTKDSNGRPCPVLDYNVAPKYDFFKLTY